jgi:hypothetical protein
MRRILAAALGGVRDSVGTFVRDDAGASAHAVPAAIQSRSIPLAEISAREAGRLRLEDALALVASTPGSTTKFDRAAVRWLARLASEKRLTLAQVQAAAAALASLPDEEERALRMLADLAR